MLRFRRSSCGDIYNEFDENRGVASEEFIGANLGSEFLEYW